MIYAESCRVGHPATKTARAKATSFARESHNFAVPTVFASDAKKAVNWNATAKIGLELVNHEGGQFTASRFQIRQERRQVILYGSVEQRLFGSVASAGTGTRDHGGMTNRCRQQGRPRQRLSDAQPTSCASPGASHIPWGTPRRPSNSTGPPIAPLPGRLTQPKLGAPQLQRYAEGGAGGAGVDGARNGALQPGHLRQHQRQKLAAARLR